MIEQISWRNEQAPQDDSTGTIAESWSAEVNGYHARIDRFTEGGYAYTVTDAEGNPLWDANNESAESFERADRAVWATLIAVWPGNAIMVNESNGTFEIPGSAEPEDWQDVRTAAEEAGAEVDEGTALIGWGSYKRVHRITYPSGDKLTYFVEE